MHQKDGHKASSDSTAEPTLQIRQSRRFPTRFWLGWGIALALTLLVVLLISLPPFAGTGFRTALMYGFSTVCHQIPARSPHLDGVQLAVCHRCYGIYLGLPLAVFVYLSLFRFDAFLSRYARWILGLSLLPASIDWGLGATGIWHNTPTSRLLTGGIFGLVAGAYLVRALVDMTTNRRTQALLTPRETVKGEAGGTGTNVQAHTR